MKSLIFTEESKKKVKLIISRIGGIFKAVKAAIVWGLDMYSDISVILILLYCIDHVRVKLEEKEKDETKVSEIELQVKSECKLNSTTDMKEGLKIINNILSKYIFQLRLVFIGAVFLQCQTSWIALGLHYGEQNNVLVFGYSILAVPLAIFTEMVRTEWAL